MEICQIITTGTTINLLDQANYALIGWEPGIAQWKNDGVTVNPVMGDNSYVALRSYENGIETFVIGIAGQNQNEVIVRYHNLMAILDQAVSYWSNSYTPIVYLAVKADGEASTRYAAIYKYRLEKLPPLFGGSLVQGILFNGRAYPSGIEITLVIERGHWLKQPPGSSSAVAIENSYNWQYAPAWQTASTDPSYTVFDMIQVANGDIYATERYTMWKSTDNGANWTGVNLTTWNYAILELANDYILVGGLAMYRSINGGANWSEVISSDAAFRCIFQASNGYVYAGRTGGGIYRSTDNGANWTLVETMATVVTGIIEGDNGRLLANMSGTIYYSDNNGDTWTLLFTAGSIAILKLSTGTILSFGSDGTYRSVDGGLNWTLADAPLSLTGGEELADGRVLGFGTYAYYSEDDGLTWRYHSNTSIQCAVELSNGNIFAGDGNDITKYVTATAQIGPAAATGKAVFVANKYNRFNLQHILAYDASAVTYTEKFPLSLPAYFFPDPPETNDIVYFGITADIGDRHSPFNSLVFNLAAPVLNSSTFTLAWKYSTAAGMVALTVRDGTAIHGATLNAFTNSGRVSVHWITPADFAPYTVNGIGAYWISVEISAGIGVGPQQQTDQIYAATQPYVDLPAVTSGASILPALAQLKLFNRSANWSSALNHLAAPSLYANRIVGGTRRLDRGELFSGYINLDTLYFQEGIEISLAAGAIATSVVSSLAPTGYCIEFNPSGAVAISSQVLISFWSGQSSQFHGTYRVFLRGKRSGGSPTDAYLRLRILNNSLDVFYTTANKRFYGDSDYSIIDFGLVAIPGSQATLSDETAIYISIDIGAVDGDPTVYLYDLILIPSDEWIGDFADKAFLAKSNIGDDFTAFRYLDIDSVTNPKVQLRAMLRQEGSSNILQPYQAATSGPLVIQPNGEAQRLWLLAMRGTITGGATGADDSATLTDANVDFVAAGVQAGMTVYNVTDGSSAVITAVTATTVAGTLAGGSQNDWDTNDIYWIDCPYWTAPPDICHTVQINKNDRLLDYDWTSLV